MYLKILTVIPVSIADLILLTVLLSLLTDISMLLFVFFSLALGLRRNSSL